MVGYSVLIETSTNILERAFPENPERENSRALGYGYHFVDRDVRG